VHGETFPCCINKNYLIRPQKKFYDLFHLHHLHHIHHNNNNIFNKKTRVTFYFHNNVYIRGIVSHWEDHKFDHTLSVVVKLLYDCPRSCPIGRVDGLPCLYIYDVGPEESASRTQVCTLIQLHGTPSEVPGPGGKMTR